MSHSLDARSKETGPGAADSFPIHGFINEVWKLTQALKLDHSNLWKEMGKWKEKGAGSET